MGSGHSSISDLPQNSHLIKLSKEIPIKRNDKFWDQLLSFKFSTPLERLVYTIYNYNLRVPSINIR